MRLRMICADQTLVDGPGYLASGDCYRVGRSSRCAFVLDDLSVSRVHAEVTVADETMRVKDLRSRNGTFVDGVRVTEAELQPGQTVRFGSALFHVVGELIPQEKDHDNSAVSTHLMKHLPTLQPDAMKDLSDAQRRVFDLLLLGLSQKEAAVKLDISPNTVHHHVTEIYRKLGVSSRAELLALFIAGTKKPEK